ncbi:class I SAM-dependent methyltransferase [Rossellomorea sp. SC111]|uniref:class I SAM-dependent methyltransferase n=1 Tax=Rossellomorea sp. SC111 TaxID=2968985 RepID=UPI00215A7B2B|nr:class I SAM-dependent methyltransferase [Rossellomorea sp. SC111]MCR8849303.1 class I SAM-dependent methyltransferase [Rossellomorea sp. SC111]
MLRTANQLRTKPTYQTWIRVNKLLIFLGISLLFLMITFFPISIYLRILSGMLALPFLYIVFILSYSIFQFAGFGGNYQSKIHDVIVSRMDVESGKILDIGTGSGSLIIKIAKRFPHSSLIGIDYWGENWEYSKAQCEENAEIEGVSDRIQFLKASASKLPFRDAEFDVVVSCLTFHEVKDSRNKTDVIREAFRVLKPGGTFVFMDLFLDEAMFGERTELVADLTDTVELKQEKLTDVLNLPKLLLNKKVLGNAMVFHGKKTK